jgi:hypothetical protein
LFGKFFITYRERGNKLCVEPGHRIEQHHFGNANGNINCNHNLHGDRYKRCRMHGNR